jgi:hypothetical protein
MSAKHELVMDGNAARCAGCGHVIFGLAHLQPGQMEAMFRNLHGRQYEPGNAPDITVEWELVAQCSVCPDGGSIELVDSEGVRCTECRTTWAIDGSMGEREQ